MMLPYCVQRHSIDESESFRLPVAGSLGQPIAGRRRDDSDAAAADGVFSDLPHPIRDRQCVSLNG